MSTKHLRLRSRMLQYVALCAGVAWWWGCGSGEGAGLDVASLRVHTTTSGVELDADGYGVVVDAGVARPIGINSSLEIGGLADGSHRVELLGVAPNCEVQGASSRSVGTASGSTADVRFDVECAPGSGSVRVITRTTGSDQDEDGYVVVVNGDARQIGSNASITYDDVSAGDAVIEILGVAANCSAAGETYYEVGVVGGQTFEVTFAFDCSPRQPGTGTIQVITATSGPSPDSDGYLVAVDGVAGNQIDASGNLLLTGIPIGERSVALSGIAANCAVSGANPRTAFVTGTELVIVAFAVVCTQPPGATGTLRLTTSSTGPDLDPTGYTIVVDGTVRQPVGVNATVTIAGLTSGSHSVALEDLTPNCTTTDNPRSVSLPEGAETRVTFTVSCIAAFGYITSITQTTGSEIDPDGYIVRVNGGAGKPIPANGTTTRGGLAPGSHTTQLDNVAANCQVQGDNPRAVVVAGYETTTVRFEVLCVATTGSMAVTVTGLPVGAAPDVVVTGLNGFLVTLSATTTLDRLTPGEYTVSANAVTFNGVTYQPTIPNQVTSVAAGRSVAVSVVYGSGPGSAVNFRIARMYITQGSQTPAGEVPLVEGRDGYLRVFVVADRDNNARPPVRVRLVQDGGQAQTVQIEAPTVSVPTLVREQDLDASWNLRIPGNVIRRGMSLLAEVDPGGQFAEDDETDNAFPQTGNPAPLTVRRASPFAVTLVPVQLGSGGLVGDLSPSNIGRYLNVTQNVHPLPGIDVVLRSLFISSLSPAQAGDVNAALSYALSELLAIRTIESSDRTYYGVTHRSYSSGGIAGLGYLGAPAALGWDDPSQAGSTAAHEFGHTWDRRHAPCGNPAHTDPQYPYVGAVIGQYGFDLANEVVIGPETHDLMSYCHPRWVSDYTYTRVMDFRQAFQSDVSERRRSASAAQPSLVVWGRIENGRPILEPAFLVRTRPSMPSKSGPYRLQAVGLGGGQLFDVTFEATPVADGVDGAEHFAFAIPLDPAAASELSTLRLESPVGFAEVSVPAAPPAQLRFAPQAKRVGARVQLVWDAASARMVMVRDAATGEVLAFARGTSIELPTRADQLEVHLSDGVRSKRVELRVGP